MATGYSLAGPGAMKQESAKVAELGRFRISRTSRVGRTGTPCRFRICGLRISVWPWRSPICFFQAKHAAARREPRIIHQATGFAGDFGLNPIRTGRFATGHVNNQSVSRFPAKVPTHIGQVASYKTNPTHVRRGVRGIRTLLSACGKRNPGSLLPFFGGLADPGPGPCLRLQRPGLHLAYRCRQGDHRYALQRLCVLLPAHERVSRYFPDLFEPEVSGRPVTV
jgi:hypothetical protein